MVHNLLLLGVRGVVVYNIKEAYRSLQHHGSLQKWWSIESWKIYPEDYAHFICYACIYLVLL